MEDSPSSNSEAKRDSEISPVLAKASLEIKPYREIRVSNWKEARELFTKYGSKWVFRGQSDASRELTTSFEREIAAPVQKERPPGSRSIFKLAQKLTTIEITMYEEFLKGAHLFLPGAQLPPLPIDRFALMQHYGTPTRLLDFTVSPYVAAYFAMAQRETEQGYSVWALDRQLLSSITSDLFGNRLSDYGPSYSVLYQDNLLQLFQYATLNAIDMILPIEPRTANERLLVQQGLFVLPLNIANSFMANLDAVQNCGWGPFNLLHKIVIPKSARLTALEDLYRMNVTFASLYPGLEGYARSIANRVLIEWNIDSSLWAAKENDRTSSLDENDRGNDTPQANVASNLT
jgi:hypothetical protein